MLRELMVPPVTDDTDPVKRQQLRDLAIMNGTYKETTKSFGTMGVHGLLFRAHRPSMRTLVVLYRERHCNGVHIFMEGFPH